MGCGQGVSQLRTVAALGERHLPRRQLAPGPGPHPFCRWHQLWARLPPLQWWASHPHLLPSCWQHGAARTVYQLLTHTIFALQRLHGFVQLISCGAYPKEHRKSKAILGFFQTNPEPITLPMSVCMEHESVLTARQVSIAGKVLALRHAPGWLQLTPQMDTLLSHPSRPQAGLCVRHIWPLFKTPPQSISQHRISFLIKFSLTYFFHKTGTKNYRPTCGSQSICL